uniref:Uncharacterized protein n=1 Tax=Acrobeloides nanus TaxID=290746 RepID=A0A914DGW9_9BILA
MSEDTHDYVFKVILAGESGVGKSSILRRYCQDRFNLDERFTVGIEFRTRTMQIDTSKIKAQIWDTAGNERFRALTPMYFRGAHGAILVYDITNHQSFRNIQYWLDTILDHTNLSGIVILLIGNKCDLDKIRTVPTDEARMYAEERGLIFLETSAKDSTNIEIAFNVLLKKIYKEERDKKNGTTVKKKFPCC